MKKLPILAVLTLLALASCGGNTSAGGSTTPAQSEKTTVKDPDSSTPTSSTPEKVETPYVKQYLFFSPGNAYSEETKETGEANTLISQSFTNTKHKGPNYYLYVNLLKDGNKVEAGRVTLYYSGALVNKARWTAAGTWSANSDSTYTIKMDAFKAVKYDNAAASMTSTADGKLVWNFTQKDSDDGEEKSYSTTLVEQKALAGEYTGTYTNQEGETATMDSLEVTALADGTYTMKGAIEDSGISAFEGTVSQFGVASGKTPRLDGTMSGLFYTDYDGTVKFHFDMEARERKSTADGTHL